MTAPRSLNSAEQVVVSGDEDYVLIEYAHPNRGGHRVIGVETKTFYGHRSAGERFLVHKNDIRRQPNFFIPVKEQDTPKPEPEPVEETPEPVLISHEEAKEQILGESEPEISIPEPEMTATAESERMATNAEPEPDAPIAVLEITSAQHEKLMDAGFETVQDIVNAERNALLDIPGFGPATVDAVMNEVRKWLSL